MEVSSVSKQLRAMCIVPDLDIVALEQLYQLTERLSIPTRHRRRRNGRRSKQRVAIQSREYLGWCGEELGKTQSEVIGAISWGREEIARYLKGCSSDAHKDVRLEELLGETRYYGRQYTT
jgi:hypothetical protein